MALKCQNWQYCTRSTTFNRSWTAADFLCVRKLLFTRWTSQKLTKIDIFPCNVDFWGSISPRKFPLQYNYTTVHSMSTIRRSAVSKGFAWVHFVVDYFLALCAMRVFGLVKTQKGVSPDMRGNNGIANETDKCRFPSRFLHAWSAVTDAKEKERSRVVALLTNVKNGRRFFSPRVSNDLRRVRTWSQSSCWLWKKVNNGLFAL